MSMQISGLVSGLDTGSIIEQLMQVEAIPQTYVKQKLTSTNTFVTALQALNAKVSSLADNAKNVTTPTAFDKWTATSSSTHATASASETASITDIEFRVNKLAQGQVSLSSSLSSPADLVTDGKFTFTTGAGDSFKEWSVDIADDATLSDLATAINKSTAGVRASVISTGNNTFRLQLTSENTGEEAGQFAVTSGNGQVSFSDLKQAQDAEIELWPGAGLPDSVVKSATNTFEGLATGLTVTVAKVHGADEDATSIRVNKDSAAITKLASNLVSQVGQVLSEISSRSGVTVSSKDSTTTGGLFTGDAQTRLLSSQISDALSYPVNGKSPSTIGIEIQRDGTFTFNETKFKEALESDPEGTQDFLRQLGERVYTVANNASDKYDGSITQRINSQQSLSQEYQRQIDNWDIRLELRRATLEKTYSALEVALSNLQKQQSQLVSALSSLTAATAS